MKDMEQAKNQYEATEIPAELTQRVQAGIRQGRAAYRREKARRTWRRCLTGAAACLVVGISVLNLSPTVAAAAAETPVLGGLFQVLTFRNDTLEQEDYRLDVNQPALVGTELARQVTEEIQTRVDAKIAEGEQLVADYKEAFLATGGTEEQWAERENEISVSYEIKSQTDTTVSFVVDSYVSIASAYQEQTYYNLDLAAGRELTLADLLGENWVEICNDAIRTQMAEAEDPSVYFAEDMGGFDTVDENTAFYCNAEGEAVVVFPRGMVAVGYLGTVEFVISEA